MQNHILNAPKTLGFKYSETDCAKYINRVLKIEAFLGYMEGGGLSRWHDLV